MGGSNLNPTETYVMEEAYQDLDKRRAALEAEIKNLRRLQNYIPIGEATRYIAIAITHVEDALCRIAAIPGRISLPASQDRY